MTGGRNLESCKFRAGFSILLVHIDSVVKTSIYRVVCPVGIRRYTDDV